ncbi:exopolysaccharide biosynthesis polyprenyl glycosylphosphotransferase [Novosphingobium cyanobacteriorum]|uniref:Exopolysaccharide biosynthesis polyprenyl glycosylphosphotransferase n=1 Tax=Novosphingobium cyanobacteriorum TaxID=3024215 RepID=A0ABT6CR49_9SPHN|nr:exopolysaccharide biosynthesis polyprenyl glycosylphosphotransferase [Novosphingobium cyanobacteriorum]MDF8334982.1 exopolysaccharide biosynthesis polyprenyl glycosylphosphotransferase [Novosphingobium cyanobacteriorum]
MSDQATFNGMTSASTASTRKGHSKALLRARLAFALLPLDFLAIAIGFSASSLTRFGTSWSNDSSVLVIATLLLYLICGSAMRAYSGMVLVSHTYTVSRSIGALAIASVTLATLLFLLKAGERFSRIEVAIGMLYAALALVVIRLLYVRYSRVRLEGALYSELVLRDGVLGSPQRAVPAIDVAAYFNVDCPGPEDYDRLAQVLGQVDRVIVECPAERRAAWAHVLKGMNVHAEVVAPELSDFHPMGIGRFANSPTLVIAQGPLGLRDRLMKRLFDTVFSGLAVLFFSPLLIFVALAIKLDSEGPVFFRQPRIGRQNRIFYVFKFRSMHVNQLDHGGTRSTQRGDPRVTRVGRIIRATSIDELPQLFNVLKGDMSVVGPRPHAIHSTAEDLLFWDIDSRYWQRHACKPGITGLAQVKGFRGATNYKRDLTDRVTADLEYLARWTLWNDILIIMRTFAVLVHKNAY